MIFPLHRNPKDIDPSYKTELGFFSSFVYVCVSIFVEGVGVCEMEWGCAISNHIKLLCNQYFIPLYKSSPSYNLHC